MDKKQGSLSKFIGTITGKHLLPRQTQRKPKSNAIIGYTPAFKPYIAERPYF